MFQAKAVEKTTKCVQQRFSRKSCLLRDNVKNIVERGRPQKTIWRMRIACWVSQVTIAHSEYVLLIAFPTQQ